MVDNDFRRARGFFLRRQNVAERVNQAYVVRIHDDSRIRFVYGFIVKAALYRLFHGHALDLPHHARHVVFRHARAVVGQNRAEVEKFA